MIMLYFLACASETTFSGTFVGNPGKGNSQIASSEGIVFSRAATSVQHVYYFRDDSEFVHSPNQDLDLLNSSAEFPIMAGNWSSIVLEMEPGLSLEGNANDSQQFTWDLPSLFIRLDFSEPGIEEGEYLFSLGQTDWLDAQQIEELAENANTFAVEDNEDFQNSLIDALETESALFRDSDGDGIISDEERENSIANGTDLDEDEEFDPLDFIDPYWQE